jgi:hypothetical protein
VRTITVYEADDGSRWNTPDEARMRDVLIADEARMRDVLIAECETFAAREMRPRPDNTDFANGHGFVLQPPGARERLLAWLRAKGANRDSSGPIGKLLWRLQCMDDLNREWGQPYFALHPDKAPLREPVEVP